MINVLIADDSKATRMFLQHLLESDADISVIGVVANGAPVLEFLQGARPDVVVIGVCVPGMDGLETTRRIMETQPLPIVVCSVTANELVFRALESGAIACIEMPVAGDSSYAQAAASHLIQSVKLMSEVKVVRRWPKSASDRVSGRTLSAARLQNGANVKIVGIGASTGGPPALQTIIRDLPGDFPVPVLVVQHIAKGFLPGMVTWLRQTTGKSVAIASNGTLALPGHVYLAPDGSQMGITRDGHISLSRAEAENGIRPAVGFLFRSLAEMTGASAIGVLLTGMGKDGAAELKEMKVRGAVTIAQDRESSVVHGMPGTAVALGGATYVLPVSRIANALTHLVNSPSGNMDLDSE